MPEGWLQPFASSSNKIVPTTLPPASSSPLPPPNTASTIITDTGATCHFLTSTAPYGHKQPANPGIAVLLPNGSTLQPTHMARLLLPTLPPKACKVHIFPNLAFGSLVSIRQLCDHGCTAHFDAATVTIRLHSKMSMKGCQLPIIHLWTLDLPETMQPKLLIPSLNYLVHNPNLAKRIAFYHAAMFSPALCTKLVHT
jgi:hypothetical protein